MITVAQYIALLKKLPQDLPCVVNSAMGEYWMGEGPVKVDPSKEWHYPRKKGEVPPSQAVELR